MKTKCSRCGKEEEASKQIKFDDKEKNLCKKCADDFSGWMNINNKVQGYYKKSA